LIAELAEPVRSFAQATRAPLRGGLRYVTSPQPVDGFGFRSASLSCRARESHGQSQRARLALVSSSQRALQLAILLDSS